MSAPLDEHSQALVDAVDAVVAGWVVACVERVLGTPLAPDVAAAAADAGQQARRAVVDALTDLLGRDIDEQRTNPLSILRGAVRFPTAVLRAAGAPPAARDEFLAARFAEDVYDLSPATWSDVHPSLHEPGLIWGAWKAHQHLSRRRHAASGDAGDDVSDPDR